MNKQNTDILCNKFPYLYNKNFGFECGDGWFDLIYTLSKKLNIHILNTPKENQHFTKAVQVKEKFGTLRFYMSSGTDKMFDLISKAEKESEKTCEICGKSGKLWTGGWLVTLCDNCHEKR